MSFPQHAMRATHTQAPQPLPLPLPPPPLSLPSPPASSFVSTASSLSPSPSPARSPRASTTSFVPFSWERHPGVPKNSFRGGFATSEDAPLPLPPPLRLSTRRRRRRRANANASAPAASADRGANSDPFVAAFAECSIDGDDTDAAVEDKLWLAPTKPPVSGRAERRWWLSASGFVGFLDLYGCKNAMAVADDAFLVRRPVAARSRPGRAARR